MAKYNALDLVTGERLSAPSMRKLKRRMYKSFDAQDNVRIWREGQPGHYVTSPRNIRNSDLSWDFWWSVAVIIGFGIYTFVVS